MLTGAVCVEKGEDKSLFTSQTWASSSGCPSPEGARRELASRGLRAHGARAAAENGCRKTIPTAVLAPSPKSVPLCAPRLPIPQEREARGPLPWLGQDSRWAWVQTQSPHSWFCSAGTLCDVLGLSLLLYGVRVAMQGSFGPLAVQKHGRQLDTSTS